MADIIQFPEKTESKELSYSFMVVIEVKQDEISVAVDPEPESDEMVSTFSGDLSYAAELLLRSIAEDKVMAPPLLRFVANKDGKTTMWKSREIETTDQYDWAIRRFEEVIEELNRLKKETGE